MRTDPFTELTSLNGESYALFLGSSGRKFEALHSSFFNATLQFSMYDGIYQTVGLTNNFFRSGSCQFAGNSPSYFYCYNNTFKDGIVSLSGGNTNWQVLDNLFDGVTLLQDTAAVTSDYNGYLGMTNRLAADATWVTNGTLSYQAGPLGRWYVPSNSVLANAGRRTAASAGLHHFTTTTNQVRETNSTVDIGFHYVALSPANLLVDTDGDSLADYAEDANGNGGQDSGETSPWLADTDNDGLTDGYEVLVSHTTADVANSPRAIYEAAVSNQNPSAWFKLNDGSLADAVGGSPLTNSGALWDVDAFATGSNAVSFNGNTQRLTAGDVISGGNGLSKGSMSLLFRSLIGYTTNAARYLFSQKGNATNEFGVFFETTNTLSNPGSLKMQIGGQTNVILASNAIAFATWYYLAMTWDETGHAAKWYLAPIGGTLTNGTINLATNAVVGSSSNVYVGNRLNDNGTFTNAFRSPGNGALDQIAFWNRELTNTEVNAQFDTLTGLFQGPAKVFDLTRWNLLLPMNSDGQLTGTDSLEISTGWLNSGFRYVVPTNWTQKYFYLSNGTNMVFEAPWNGAKTGTSSGARSELRGTNPDGSKDNWLPLGTKTLEATCVVESAGTNNTRKVIIGQFHSETATVSGPPVVISYNHPSNKVVTATYKSSPTSGADINFTLATNVNVLVDQIHYQVRLTGDGTNINLHAHVFINDVLQTPDLNIPMASSSTNAWHTNTFYFKAGCYYPTNGSGVPAAGTAKVTFSSLTATHQP